jgi:hypothetical protein
MTVHLLNPNGMYAQYSDNDRAYRYLLQFIHDSSSVCYSKCTTVSKERLQEPKRNLEEAEVQCLEAYVITPAMS